MKNKNLLLTIVLCCIAASAFESCKSPDSINSTDRHASAQKKFNVYGVGFYNQENLFDTCHDAGKNDYEFLPTGSNRWSGLKYTHKLQNMSRALADMGTDMLPGVGCAVIGVSEVENAKCLTDLCNQEPLLQRNMQFILVEGPDDRGVDCALLYNPALFTPTDTAYHYNMKKDMPDSISHTRGFLTVTGQMAGETVTIIVCHWPSRFAGSEAREWAGEQVRRIKDDLLRQNPQNKIFVMGDLNDDPTDKSVTQGLGGKAEINKTGDGDMYNPWYNVLAKQGQGTLAYNGAWNLFDQILMTPNLLDRKGEKDYSGLTYLKCQIQRRDYLIQTEGKYKGNPKRTHAGGVWLDGYSDHLPVVVYLVKEQK